MAAPLDALLAQARRRVGEPTPLEALAQALESPDPPTVLDVRERHEFDQGHIPGALHVPRGSLELRISELVPELDRPIVVYCAAGTRSLLAAATLLDLGYQRVASAHPGFTHWQALGLPVATPPLALRPDQLGRYARHLALPEVGVEGQAKLLTASVLLVGAGGLGSPAALYLAAAGVGTIGIVDHDRVDASNLQRQVLHRSEDVGVAKVTSAERALTALNPDVTVVGHPYRLDRTNAERTLAPYDLVIDGSDNFSTRYLLADASVLLRKPVVHGSIYRFEGQVTLLDPAAGGPCYRCLYAAPPPPEAAPNCAQAGVLGVLPGVIGVLQATEALKWLLGLGESLAGRLLTYDALDMSFRSLRIPRAPDCALCGPEPTIVALAETPDACASSDA